jgi:hypothetical protein
MRMRPYQIRRISVIGDGFSGLAGPRESSEACGLSSYSVHGRWGMVVFAALG